MLKYGVVLKLTQCSNWVLLLQYKPDGTGGWTFTCQHGDNECIGNLYQACLLNGLENENRLQVEAVNCIMSADKPNLATEV